MDLTNSYESVIPKPIRDRYDWAEVRNAAAILKATNPKELQEVLLVLGAFCLKTEDIVEAGGEKSTLAKRLDGAFRDKGWREGRHDVRVSSVLTIMPHKPAKETEATVKESTVLNEGYKVDNVKGRMAVDLEWHAKDGNLDRDVACYRALYEAGIIDGAVIITRSYASIRALSVKLGREDGFSTTTTTTIEKLEPRLTRGDGGGCPILAVAITSRCHTP